MRKLQALFALLLVSIPAYLAAQDSRLSLDPKFPAPGTTLNFSYNPAGSELEGAAEVNAAVYVYEKTGMYVEEKLLTKSGERFTGTVNLPAEALVVGFLFTAGEKKDNNGTRGFVTQVFDDKQQPVRGSGRVMFNLVGAYGGYNLGIERNPEAGFAYIEKEYKDYPEDIKDNFVDYFRALQEIKHPDAETIVAAELARLEALDDLTEQRLSSIAAYYGRLKQKEKADAITKRRNDKFPNGRWKMNEEWQQVMSEEDANVRAKRYEEFIAKYKLQDESMYKTQLIASFAKDKKWDLFNNAIKDLDINENNGFLNNTAWNWAEKDENLELAKKISKMATDWAKQELVNPQREKPRHRTAAQWKEDREFTYSMYADTYAYILYKLKDYKTGFQYAKEAAVDIRKKKDAEYNERYALLLEKVAPAAQVKKEMEELVKAGTAGRDAREVLQRAYVKVNKSDKGYEAYLANLDAENLARIKEELKKKMIAKDAPGFRLVNIEGKEVDFASLKGKVVVVDFWATWCGPCIASFPSMQKMVNKYKNNPDVVFLFIDTWETSPNRKKLVEEFIAKNKYSFNVLYDLEKAPGTNDYAVVKEYEVEGIPTKFVVDGNGQIRFKSVGWSGNEFEFMQELQLMIEMAKNGGGESGKKGF